jgi:hypothetical protein
LGHSWATNETIIREPNSVQTQQRQDNTKGF